LGLEGAAGGNVAEKRQNGRRGSWKKERARRKLTPFGEILNVKRRGHRTKRVEMDMVEKEQGKKKTGSRREGAVGSIAPGERTSGKTERRHSFKKQ